MEYTFYVVWNPQTGYTKFQHESKNLAELEAKRLAKQYEDENFIVLKAISAHKRTSVSSYTFKTKEGVMCSPVDEKDFDEIPF